MMRTICLNVLLATLLMATFIGCSFDEQEETDNYTKISAEEAKEMMDEDDSVIILDVRTKEEFSQGHIEDAVLLPVNDISDLAG